jgi:flavin reductase (DIM6/NTAB) family NADH-FMN oxidoreductase RutF
MARPVADAEESFHTLVADEDYPMLVVTVAAGGQRDGCLVGFSCQASIQPPRMLVMLSTANHTYRLAVRAELLGVHFLHRDNGPLARLFGEETADNVDKLARCSWAPGLGGTPILAGTRGWIVGRIRDRVPAGDHVAHILDLADGAVDIPGPQLSFQMARRFHPGHPA